jgi:predicted nucleotide-binding protein (sugar kinase/HSP70/actin superfamily)
VNIWVYAARLFNLAEVGTEFVLQGGTQRNLAAVRAQVVHIEEAFEHCGRVPIIHVHPHPAEAGAIGAALLAAHAQRSRHASGWIGFEALEALRYSTEQSEATRCGRCDNRCARTFIHVGRAPKETAGAEGPTLIVAPCEKGRDSGSSHAVALSSVRDTKAEHGIPNFATRLERQVYSVSHIRSVMHELGQALSSGTTRVPGGTRILLPRILNHSLYAPTFIAWFLAMGFGEEQLVLSPRSTRAMSSEAMARATIDPCFPAKIAFAHIEALLHEAACQDGEQWLFHPAILRIPSEIDDVVDSMTCTVAAVMPEVVHAAFTMEGDTFRGNNAEFLRPFLSMENEESFAACMTGFFASRIHASPKDFRRAANTAWRVQAEVMRRIRAEASDCLRRLEAESRLGVVMLGRPYHMDRALNHGILDALHAMHVPIFTAETLPRDAETLRRVFGAEEPSCVRDVWPNPYSENSSRKMWAAKYVARHPNLIAVELSSFKCGHDAPTYSIVRDMMAAAGKPLFSFLDLDENTPRSSLNIRVETIGHFLRQWCCERGVMLPACPEKEELCLVAS